MQEISGVSNAVLFQFPAEFACFTAAQRDREYSTAAQCRLFLPMVSVYRCIKQYRAVEVLKPGL